MPYLIIEAALSGIIVMGASEVAKSSPTYGALLVSLPLVSILTMLWLWRDSGDIERIAALSEGTFWLVLPTLPIFSRTAGTSQAWPITMDRVGHL